MACLCRVMFILVLMTSAHAQFFADFFTGFQPFATNQPTLRSIFEVTTRRPVQAQNYHRRTTKTTKQEDTTKPYGNDRNSVNPQFNIDREEIDNRKRKTTSFSNSYTTTLKPKKKDTIRRLINNDKRQNIQDYNNNNNKDYDGKINAIGDYYTQRPNYNYNNRPDYSGNNYYTTENPFNKGVKPVVTNGPPITNKPVTRRPNFGVNPRPRDEDAIAFPDDDVSPEVIIGPDEDNMSDVEKRRYIELAERKCDEYKSLGQRAVQAIPLLPSPEPVEINVGKCAPTTVPLVVGGKVVGIHEFPHMALLGWRKIQTGGYAWKCGGSLVSERFVLTAAHCSFQDRDNNVVNGPPRAVQLGSSNLDDPGALVIKVTAVIRHPKYKLPRSYYDLALVKLATSVKFSEVIKPACLGSAPAVGQAIIATGWGRTEYGGDQSHELRSVSLPVWSLPRCRDVLGTSRKLPDGPSADSQICAGDERGGKDTCQGDSGGPAQIQEGCIWRVVGVTSLGRSCGAAETPGLYAKVQKAFVASQIFASEPIRNYTTKNNYGNNNDNSGNNNENYGNNNGNYGNNNGNYGNNNANSWNNNANYGSNNRQDSIYSEQPSNTNYNNRRPQSNGQDYNTPSPDRNVNYNTGGQDYNGNNKDDDYYNRGRPNNNQQDDNSQATNNRPTRYSTTQKPNRNDGIVFNYNNDDYNSQSYYTTRKPIRSNNNDYANNYNSQNYGSSNRNQDNNRSNNYGYNNNQPTQRAQSNYGDNRQSNQEDYTVNRQWWLT